MTVAWESASSDIVSSTSDTSLAPAKPTGLAVGDLLLGFGFCLSSKTIAPPAGWTQVSNDSDGTIRVYIWSKVADSTDAAASTFTFTVSGTFAVASVSLHRVSSASTNSPTTSFSTGINSQTQVAPTLTTPSNNCLVFWGVYGSSNGSSTASKGTERIDTGSADAGQQSQYTNLEATAGSITGATITTTAFGAKRVYSIAIESAAVASSPVGKIVGTQTAVSNASFY